MSYQSRQRKRRYKRLEAQAKRKRSAGTAQRWFLTLARKPGKCGRCGDGFGRGAEIVYRHEGRDVRCLHCADRDPEARSYRASMRWERARRLPKAA
jgi:hypothetical protein